MAVPNGVIHCPITPFTGEGALDLAAVAQLVAFHADNGAAAICLPLHEAELFNLRPEERKALVEAAASALAGKVPLLVHASASATHHAVDLAKHAEAAGAAAVMLAPPYYWRLNWSAVEDYYLAVAQSIGIGVIGYNVPPFQRGDNIPAAMVERLIERLPNFVGLVDASFNYEYLAELKHACQGLRPDFGMIFGAEYLLPAAMLGFRTCLSTTSAVAPRLVAQLYEVAIARDVDAARPLQHRVSLLRRVLRDPAPAALKSAHSIMGRHVGAPRRPLRPLAPSEQTALAEGLAGIDLTNEPKGW